MTITVRNLERLTLDEMKEFLDGTRTMDFVVEGQEAVYAMVECVLRAQQYRRLKKGHKGVVRRFLARITGLSRAQVTRLAGRWQRTRRVTVKRRRRPNFPTRYTTEDIVLLAEVDAAHEDLSGPAVRRILEREYAVFGKRSTSACPPSRCRTSTICDTRPATGTAG